MSPLEESQSIIEACPVCKHVELISIVSKNLRVCARADCGYHFPLRADERLDLLCEPGSFQEWDAGIGSLDPLGFPGYQEKVARLRADTGRSSAAVTGCAVISGFTIAIAMTEYRFMAGAMNSAVGERFARCIERATEDRLPILLISGSGAGAMMQEGLLSLMQMAIVSAALGRHKSAGLLSVCLLTDASYGGVMASWGSLAHVIIAEPKARIGFIGGRVSGMSPLEFPPPQFRTAEYQLEHGALDRIVPRREQKALLTELLSSLAPAVPESGPETTSWTVDSASRSAIERVKLARDVKRPHASDYLRLVFERFIELRGDRSFGDDPAIIGGLARIAGRPVVVIGHEKGRSASERQRRNHGCAKAEGYRKAARLMELANQLGCPLICLVDTQGADASPASENRGISRALASCQELAFKLKVPILSAIIGEGGSGGAIALACGDRVLMQQHAYYSVIAPEACAEILWKDKRKAAEAAEALKITSEDALRLGIIEGVVPEPEGGAQNDEAVAAQYLQRALARHLRELDGLSDLPERRYRRFRNLNAFLG